MTGAARLTELGQLAQTAEILGPLWTCDPKLDERVWPLLDALAAPASASDLATAWPYGGCGGHEDAAQEGLRDETVRNEIVRDETVREKTVQAEPLRDEAVQNETVGNESVGNETVRDFSLMAAGIREGRSAMAKEYRRLFVGPYPMPAPPYGSVYTDHDCVVFGESCLALRSWMRKHGIGEVSQAGEPEDHIGTMLELLAWLCTNKPELVEEYLRDHLLTWAPHFLDELIPQIRQPFYQGLAHLTQVTLLGIRDELAQRGIVVHEPRFYR